MSSRSPNHTAYNPLLGLTRWQLRLPRDINIDAPEKVTLLRVSVQPKEGAIRIDAARLSNEDAVQMARPLVASGFDRPPVVHSNGKRLDKLEATESGGVASYLVPLDGE